jgi:MSHA biogenesis protein MshO
MSPLTQSSRLASELRRREGFTLVEMIVVIVITGIIAAAVAVFIRLPVQGYVDTAARAELADEADTAVRRMSRDLRLALPNSVRVTSTANGQFLELLLTRAGGRYLDEEDGVSSSDGTALSFTDSSQLTFSSVGQLDISGSQKIQVQGADHGDYLVIYNLGPGQDPANAYCAGDSCGNRAKIASAPDGKTITLAANPFALQSPSLRSPGHRFQIVSSPVTYACSNGQLQRYADYPIAASQPTPPAGTPALLATDVVTCNFSYTTSANFRSALVGITLGLSKANTNTNTGQITLFHQVHVDNTP